MGDLALECDENSPVLWKPVSLENETFDSGKFLDVKNIQKKFYN
jgi:hypothetical protein